jgi:monovalent cation:proton antiporter-2 (CPA2) family protein
MHDSYLFQGFVYLLAAVIAVPIAKQLGLGSVLGYLIAGVAIGPVGFHLVGGQTDVKSFAEFGVVMMLFLVGLELRPAMLWRLRGPILGMGGAQVLATAVAIGAAGMLAGMGWRISLAAGCILAMSSTAIVLQSLSERGLLKTAGGEASFSVLLFQDISVIPIIALLPLLALAPASGGGGEHGGGHDGPLAALPGWAQALATVGAVAGLIVAGRYGLRYVFSFVAHSKMREIFTAAALLLVIGIALLMEVVGLSPALGTFLAGVVLAESEYRHQLEADIEPFKGLLLGLFFISVGADIDFKLIISHAGLIAGLLAGLLAIKFVVLLVVGRFSRMDWSHTMLFAFSLAQGGEFCFVLLKFAVDRAVFGEEIAKPLVGAVALSMAASPLLFTIHDRYIQPRFAPRKPTREHDEITEHDDPVLLAGFGRFGHVVGRLLRANGYGVTVLDNDPDQVELFARFGVKSFYGDATRLDLLHAAGAARARLFISAIDDEAKGLELVQTVRREFPHLRILARANSRQHATELLRLGVNEVYRETLGSALDLGADALHALGTRANQARRAARIFKHYDEASMRDMMNLVLEDEEYASRARQHIANLQNVLQNDRARILTHADSDAWEPPPVTINEEGRSSLPTDR